jgi:hypothetical protein
MKLREIRNIDNFRVGIREPAAVLKGTSSPLDAASVVMVCSICGDGNHYAPTCKMKRVQPVHLTFKARSAVHHCPYCNRICKNNGSFKRHTNACKRNKPADGDDRMDISTPDESRGIDPGEMYSPPHGSGSGKGESRETIEVPNALSAHTGILVPYKREDEYVKELTTTLSPDLIANLKCSHCNGFLLPPIFAYDEQSICGECFKSLRLVGHVTDAEPTIRLKPLEDLIGKGLVKVWPCAKCEKMITYKNHLEHASKCQKKYCCIFPGCEFIGDTWMDISNHVVQFHEAQVHNAGKINFHNAMGETETLLPPRSPNECLDSAPTFLETMLATHKTHRYVVNVPMDVDGTCRNELIDLCFIFDSNEYVPLAVGSVDFSKSHILIVAIDANGGTGGSTIGIHSSSRVFICSPDAATRHRSSLLQYHPRDERAMAKLRSEYSNALSYGWTRSDRKFSLPIINFAQCVSGQLWNTLRSCELSVKSVPMTGTELLLRALDDLEVCICGDDFEMEGDSDELREMPFDNLATDTLKEKFLRYHFGMEGGMASTYIHKQTESRRLLVMLVPKGCCTRVVDVAIAMAYGTVLGNNLTIHRFAKLRPFNPWVAGYKLPRWQTLALDYSSNSKGQARWYRKGEGETYTPVTAPGHVRGSPNPFVAITLATLVDFASDAGATSAVQNSSLPCAQFYSEDYDHKHHPSTELIYRALGFKLESSGIDGVVYRLPLCAFEGTTSLQFNIAFGNRGLFSNTDVENMHELTDTIRS